VAVEAVLGALCVLLVEVGDEGVSLGLAGLLAVAVLGQEDALRAAEGLEEVLQVALLFLILLVGKKL